MQSPIQHQQHPLPPMQSPIQHQQQPPMQRIKSEPMLSNMPTQPMLIIDSDEEDNNVAPPNQNINNVNSNMNPNMNTNMNQNIMDSFNSFRTSQLNNTTMLQGIKSEPNFGNSVFPTNQSPQQNQFQFNPHMNNNLTNMAVPPLGGRGRGAAGRGGNIMSPAKRKIGMPSAGDSLNNINQGYNIKMEDNNVKNETLSSPTSTSSLSWEENCELINTQTVDGVSLDVQYKCKLCGKCIKNKTSFKRHFSIHSGEGTSACPICKKSFYRLDYLERHLKTHAGGLSNKNEVNELVKLAMSAVKK